MIRLLLLASVLCQSAAEWEKAKSAFRRAFREGDAAAQRGAVRGLAAHDRVEAVELLCEAWHDSDVRLRNGKADVDVEERLRGAIALTLGSYADRMAVRFLARQAAENDSAELRETIAAAGWRYPGREMGDALLSAAKREKSAPALASTMESLRVLGRRDAIPGMVERLAHAHWRVRRAAMRALCAFDSAEAVPALIELLKEDGLFAGEINESLVLLTGEDKHGSATEWSAWWAERGASFEKKRPPREDRLAAVERSRRGGSTQATFYGLRVASKRVLFLVDLSGSMEERAQWVPETEGKRPPPRVNVRKVDVARIELRRAIERLPADAKFNVLTFESEVKRFGDRMAEPTRDRKLDLWTWMDAWELEGGTNTWLGVSTALDVAGVSRTKLDADTIYLITDGKPTLGEPAWILSKIREKNDHGKVVIHVIQVGADDPEFCGELAEQNGGSFLRK